VEDIFGNTVVTSTANIGMGFGTNPAGGTLSGTTTVSAVAGVATFDNLTVNRSASGYTLRASSSSLAQPTSSAFSVMAGPPSQVAFTAQPSDTDVDRLMSPSVRVAVMDVAGNIVVGDTRAITVELLGGPGGGVLTGTLTVNAVAGEASFSDLGVSPVGTGYTLAASAASLGATGSAAFSVRPPSIAGGRVAHHVTPTGIEHRAENLAPATIGAYVAGGDAGFVYYPGEGAADGGFRISAVPPGEYYLRYNQAYFVTSSRDVDLGYHVQGRANVQTLPDPMGGTPSTYLNTNFTTLNPYSTRDTVELYSAGAGIWNDNIVAWDVGSTPPVPGGSTLRLKIEYGFFADTRVIEATRGDQADFVQMVPKDLTGFPDAGMFYGAATKKVSTASLTVVPFGNSNVSGAMQAVPQDRALTVDWKIAGATAGSFGSYRAQVNPGATADYTAMFVSAAPANHGDYDSFPNAMKFINSGAARQLDIATTFTFGDPYPAAYTRVVYAVGGFSVPYLLAGTSTAALAPGYLGVADVQATFPASPLVPQLGPVLSPTVNGLGAFSNRTGVSTTPTIAWSPPAVGTPTRYQVSFRELFVSGSRTKQGPVLVTINTRGTQVKVPPGILEVGKSYHAIIRASRMPGVNVETQPYEQSWPLYDSEVLSGILSP
jgi:hypothetical protein